MLFPLAFMLLMVPLPAIIFNKIAFPLQLLASHVGEYTISSLDIPILREGNVLILANATLEVAEACSGIRSLVSLFTLGIVFGYFVDRRPWVRAVIALSAIPVAILANGLRVASAGVAAHNFGTAGVEGLFHEFSGWVVFIIAFLMMLGCSACCSASCHAARSARYRPRRRPPHDTPNTRAAPSRLRAARGHDHLPRQCPQRRRSRLRGVRSTRFP